MSKYIIEVDLGKPYVIKVNSDRALKRELLKLKRKAEKGDYPHFDVTVIDKKGNDVTDKKLEEFNIVG